MLYAPCSDLCDKVVKEMKENEKIKAIGQRMKKKYIEAAKSLDDKVKQVCKS